MNIKYNLSAMEQPQIINTLPYILIRQEVAKTWENVKETGGGRLTDFFVIKLDDTSFGKCIQKKYHRIRIDK